VDVIGLLIILTSVVVLWQRVVLAFLDTLQLAALLLGEVVVVGKFFGVYALN